MEKPKTTAAIVVTHNRLKKLEKCIKLLKAQSIPLDWIIVVNNDSTDGTREWLEAQNDIICINQANQGGAGGMVTGIIEAMRMGADWFWLMDDDTVPKHNSFEAMAGHKAFKSDAAGFLGSVVRWNDGSLHHMNLLNPDFVGKWLGSVLEEKSIPVLSASFVSLLVSRNAVERVGLPLRGLFIWGDDIEFTRRISSVMPCYAVLDSEVIHDTATNDGAGTQLDPSAIHSVKFWCLHRNLIALDFFYGGGVLRIIKRLVFTALRLLAESTSLKAIPVILSAFLDGILFAFANRDFQLPLKTVPVETTPVRWPRCLK